MTEVPESLAGRLAAGAVPVTEALTYAIAVAEALREVHSRGRVYGFLQPDGVTLIEGQVRLAPTGPAAISPYFSPEQVIGSDLGPRSDIFALGALMYEMLAGQPPFCAPTKTGLRMEILDREPAPLENVPPAVARVVHKCLEKKPERRVQRMEILLAELKLQEILARRAAGAAAAAAPIAAAPAAVDPGLRVESTNTKPIAVAPADGIRPATDKQQPVCPGCGSHDVHYSRPQGHLESALLLAHVSLHRCYRCYHRFLRVAGLSIRKSGNSGVGLRAVPKTSPTHKTAG